MELNKTYFTLLSENIKISGRHDTKKEGVTCIVNKNV